MQVKTSITLSGDLLHTMDELIEQHSEQFQNRKDYWRHVFRRSFVLPCSTHAGISTQVLVGIDEGLKHDSSIHCDALMSLPKSMLTDFVGSLSPTKIQELNQALKVALELE